MGILNMDTFGNSIAGTCIQTRLIEGRLYSTPKFPPSVVFLMIHEKMSDRFWRRIFPVSDLCQLSMVGYWPTMGNRKTRVRSWDGASGIDKTWQHRASMSCICIE